LKSFELESLEPRLLLSGDGLGGALLSDDLFLSDEPLDAIVLRDDTGFADLETEFKKTESGFFEVEDESLPTFESEGDPEPDNGEPVSPTDRSDEAYEAAAESVATDSEFTSFTLSEAPVSEVLNLLIT
jgi:hypothetical protein